MLRSSRAENKTINSNMRDHQHNIGEAVMLKFKIVKVHSFRIGDNRYSKGEILELSEEDAERFRNSGNLKKCVEKAEPQKFLFLVPKQVTLLN